MLIKDWLQTRLLEESLKPFKGKLQDVICDEVKHFTDPNDVYTKLLDKFVSLCNESFTIMKIRIKQRQRPFHP